ncbi:MAG: O-acetyl-ADP-ribose deacetylase [Candidatus Eisenbacteria bacterium]|nr:O-acetyl-ADP-ribose deacetylase [Candidatus Eisenbacteria bacterium]
MKSKPFERIETVQGDITELDVDAIVNAANHSLLGGGGVDGAIHRAAGPELLDFCRDLGGCATGEAVATPGFRLPARLVIHTVGPFYRGGGHGEPEALVSCYRRSLEIARDLECRTVAFPAVSTGIFGYPFQAASRIALRTTLRFLEKNDLPAKVLFVLFDERDHRGFREVLEGIEGEGE